MNGPWRSLGAAWRHSPALALWPQAVAGAREWQQALTDAAPRAMAIDAWPHEPDVALLLQPLAQSPLQGPLQGALQPPLAAGGAPSVPAAAGRAAGVARTAAAAAARFASMARAESGSAAAPLRRWMGAAEAEGLDSTAQQHSAQSVSGLTGHEARTSDRAAGSGAPSRPPSRESARAASPQASATPALVAALLARFAAGQPPPFAGPAGAAPKLANQSALWPLGHAAPAFGNVVPLRGAAKAQLKHRAAPDATPTSSPALTWRHWSSVLGRVASGAFDASGAPGAPAAHEIAALLARGERAFVDAAAAPDAGLLAAAAALRPTVQALQSTGSVATATTTVQRGPGTATGTSTGTSTGTDVPSTPAAVVDGLAGLSATMARIENHLAAAAQSAAPAPVAPQWLSDDDTLAERIHDILRRQARRHGIDTP